MSRILRGFGAAALILAVGGVLLAIWSSAPRNEAASESGNVYQAEPTATEIPPNEWVYPVPTYDVEDEIAGTPYIPEPDAAYSFDAQVEFDPYEDVSIEKAVSRADLIIQGTVVNIMPAQWTTPDGNRPENPWIENHILVTIVTPVVIKLEGKPVVNRDAWDGSSTTVVVVAAGGSVGTDVVSTTSPAQRFVTGERVLLGLSNHPYFGLEVEHMFMIALGPAWNVELKWTLTDDNMATFAHPDAPSEPLEAVLNQIREYANSQ